MKTIKEYINEGQQDLCPEVQNEFGMDYAYQSFAIKKNKYDYGFLVYDKENEFFSVAAMNNDSEYIDTFAGEYNLDADELFDLKVGETLGDNSHGDNYVFTIVRIW